MQVESQIYGKKIHRSLKIKSQNILKIFSCSALTNALVRAIVYRKATPREKKMELTQKSIAAALSLSQATVSRALRNDPTLSPALCEKVQAYARQHKFTARHYKKSAPAPDTPPRRLLLLTSGRNHLGTKLFMEYLYNFTQAADPSGLRVIFEELDSKERLEEIVGKFAGEVIGAVLLFAFPAEWAERLTRHFRCVSLNHRYYDAPVKTVEPQQEKAFYQLYRLLYDQGHRRIGFVTIKQSWSLVFQRYAGFRRAQYEVGLRDNPAWTLNMDPVDQLELKELAAQIALLYRRDGVRGFVCSSGSLAGKLIELLAAGGLRVPEEISLATFDEISEPLESGKYLSGIRADYKLQAELVVELLNHPTRYMPQSLWLSCDTIVCPGDTIARME